jgi:hypothetical protein
MVLLELFLHSGGGELGLNVSGNGMPNSVFVALRDDYNANVASCHPLGTNIRQTDCYAWNPATQRGLCVLATKLFRAVWNVNFLLSIFVVHISRRFQHKKIISKKI